MERKVKWFPIKMQRSQTFHKRKYLSGRNRNVTSQTWLLIKLTYRFMELAFTLHTLTLNINAISFHCSIFMLYYQLWFFQWLNLPYLN